MSEREEDRQAGRARCHRRRRAALAAAVFLAAAAAATGGLVAPSIGCLAPSPSLRSFHYDDASGIRSTRSALLLNETAEESMGAGSGSRRSLSLALPHGKCRVTYAELSPTPIPPAWQASFPGSGSRMTWSLIEALTGIRTTDEYDSTKSKARGYDRVVVVKTHFPVKQSGRFEELDGMFGNRAIVILRNPLNAIPSYFNQIYEVEHHLPSHSKRGPDSAWRKYRDHEGHGFSVQIQAWERFVDYWMGKYYDSGNRIGLLLVAYEDLVDPILGPLVAARMANFLGAAEGVDPIDPTAVPCVWETIVNYRNEGGENRVFQPGDEKKFDWRLKTKTLSMSLRKGGPKERPYKEENLVDMMDSFRRLMERYGYDDDFARVVASYMRTVSSTEPSE